MPTRHPRRSLPPLPRSRTPLAIIGAVGLCIAVHSCAGLKSTDTAVAAQQPLTRDRGPLAPTPAVTPAKLATPSKAIAKRTDELADAAPRLKPKVRPEPLKTADASSSGLMNQAASDLQALYAQLDKAQAPERIAREKAQTAMAMRAGVSDDPEPAATAVAAPGAETAPAQVAARNDKPRRTIGRAIPPPTDRPPLPLELVLQPDENAAIRALRESVPAAVPPADPGATLITISNVVPAPTPVAAAPQPIAPPEASAAPVQAVAATPVLEAPAPVPVPTPERRRAEAIAELASQTKPDASAIKRPVQAAMPLIALETLQAGAGAPELDKLSRSLPPSSAKSVNAVRQIIRDLSADAPALAEPGALASFLREHAERLGPSPQPAATFTLGTVALCKRVDSFGRYTPLNSSALVAGRANAIILYTEVQNFTQQPTPPTPTVDADFGSWSVELSQELQLIFDADGSRQWTQPEGSVRDVSRSRRNDYYLVQRVELPRNLSVGNYTLKVIVRDKTSGAETETNLPIQIVADPALAKAETYSQRAAR